MFSFSRIPSSSIIFSTLRGTRRESNGIIGVSPRALRRELFPDESAALGRYFQRTRRISQLLDSTARGDDALQPDGRVLSVIAWLASPSAMSQSRYAAKVSLFFSPFLFPRRTRRGESSLASHVRKWRRDRFPRRNFKSATRALARRQRKFLNGF